MPFVNMCLRTWIKKLEDDESGNLWANLSTLSFGDWLAEELKSRSGRRYDGKSSYDLLMRTFGNLREGRDSTFSPKSITSELFCVEVGAETAPPMFRPHSVPIAASSESGTAPSSPLPLVVEAEKEQKRRKSKKRMIGAVFRGSLIESSRLRRGRNANKKADTQLEAAIEKASEGALPNSALRQCREAAKKMEDLLFSTGGAERVVATLNIFKDRAAVSELMEAGSKMNDDDKMLFSSKRDRLDSIVVDRLRGFLAMLKGKGKGRRKVEDQNAYSAVIAAVSGGEITSEKLERYLAKRIGASYRQVSRGKKVRSDMEDMDNKHWKRIRTKTSGAAIKDGKWKDVVV